MIEIIPAELRAVLADTPELGAAYLVGGCVRDWLLGRPCQDFDVEVFGLDYPRLVEVLRRWGRADLVGRSFGVVKLRTASGATFDFSIPRRETKEAPGHRGFAVACDGALEPVQAAARRDYTINALMYDPRRRRLLDFFGGERDLRNRILRHTSAAFGEDPLRVLRGMQFAGRFGLDAAPETLDLCRRIKAAHAELPRERIRDEWWKWASASERPSAGLRFLARTEWIEHYPEIEALRGTPQDARWHPEGDVFEHTLECCDALAGLAEWRSADTTLRAVYMLAVLAHDIGKPSTTRRENGADGARIVSPGHDEAGGELAARFLGRLGMPRTVGERVVPLVVNHMAHLQPLTDRGVRRLARRLEPETIEGLCLVITADHFGRPPKPRSIPEGVTRLREKAAALSVIARAPRPILMGRHLIESGRAPGPEVGRILRAAYEAQLEGRFRDLAGAREWLSGWTADAGRD